ncbi:hypothetical protein ACFV4N_22760 [Actinosynnema sp. NPDC059797]
MPRRARADAVDVVAGDDEHLGGGVGADAEGVDQLRHQPFGELAQQRLVGLDLLVEVLPPAGDGAQGVLGRGGDAVDRAGTQAGAAWISAVFVKGCSCSRSSGSAVTSTALRVIMAEVRALTATSLATLIWRSISTVPSLVLGTEVAVLLSTARAAFSASMVSLLPLYLPKMSSVLVRRRGGTH